ncbi:hypothetical protein C8R45DRAFT_417440 [Mycena sanguinolenta]|nr:hypothetical protein C8R45DRAFT_417440 [Mycena sanguinolenta]
MGFPPSSSRMRCRLSARIHAVSLLFLTQVVLSTARPGASPRDISGKPNPPMPSSEHQAAHPTRSLDFLSITERTAAGVNLHSRRDREVVRRREPGRLAGDGPKTNDFRQTAPFGIGSLLSSILDSLSTPPPISTDSRTPTPPSPPTSTPAPPVLTTHSSSTSDPINTSARSSISSVPPSVTRDSTTFSTSSVSTTLSHASLSPSLPASSTPPATPSSASSLPLLSISSSSSANSFSSSSTPVSASAAESKSNTPHIVAGTVTPLLVFAVLGSTVLALRLRQHRRRLDANDDTPAPEEQQFAGYDSGREGSMRAGSVMLLLDPEEKDSGNPSREASDTDRAQNGPDASLHLSAAAFTAPHSPSPSPSPSSSPSPSPIPFPALEHATNDETSKMDNHDSDGTTADLSGSRSRVPTYATLASEESVDRTPPTPLPRYTPARPLPTIPFVRAS